MAQTWLHRADRLLILLLPALLAACGSVAVQNSALAISSVVAGGNTPTSVINQVYYLGVFDPHDQIPPTIYRLRVQGQSSALNATRFASGWVRAELIDSLGSSVAFNKQSGAVDVNGDARQGGVSVEEDKGLLTGRRLVMFGPEGFREAPKDHRLVVVMGSSPEKFFSAVDEALGVVAAVTQGTDMGPAIEKGLWADLSALRIERQRLEDLLEDTRRDDAAGG